MCYNVHTKPNSRSTLLYYLWHALCVRLTPCSGASASLTVAGRYEYGAAYKAVGNTFFKNKQYEFAFRTYTECPGKLEKCVTPRFALLACFGGVKVSLCHNYICI